MAAAVPEPQKGVILVCSKGGTLEATTASPAGIQSRSLVAAHALLQRGYAGVTVLRGGFSEWASSGREVMVMETESEGEGA
jgi:hypothetical protein